MRAEFAVGTSKLKTIHFRAEKVEEELLNAQADVSLQTILREDARKQFDAKVAELEEVLSPLEMRKYELITIHDAQKKAATKLEQLRTRTAIKRLSLLVFIQLQKTTRDSQNLQTSLVVSGIV